MVVDTFSKQTETRLATPTYSPRSLLATIIVLFAGLARTYIFFNRVIYVKSGFDTVSRGAMLFSRYIRSGGRFRIRF